MVCYFKQNVSHGWNRFVGFNLGHISLMQSNFLNPFGICETGFYLRRLEFLRASKKCFPITESLCSTIRCWRCRFVYSKQSVTHRSHQKKYPTHCWIKIRGLISFKIAGFILSWIEMDRDAGLWIFRAEMSLRIEQCCCQVQEQSKQNFPLKLWTRRNKAKEQS